MRVAFDVGGVLSKYVDEFFTLIETLERGTAAIRAAGGTGGVEVYILSDMHPKEKIIDMLRRNGYSTHPDRVIAADYKEHGELCKAIACRKHNIDVLVDDFPGYVACVGNPLVRLLVMPDYNRPYYATRERDGDPHWNTDGSEGDFGRRNPPGSKRPPEGRVGKGY